jgi:hypothetical protein
MTGIIADPQPEPDRALCILNLTRRVIAVLRKTDGSLSPGELSRQLRHSEYDVKAVLRRLVAVGQVDRERRGNRNDRQRRYRFNRRGDGVSQLVKIAQDRGPKSTREADVVLLLRERGRLKLGQLVSLLKTDHGRTAIVEALARLERRGTIKHVSPGYRLVSTRPGKSVPE